MSKQKFAELIQQSEKPVLVDFYADWCQPCKQLSPIVEEVAKDLGDKLKVIKVDVDKNQQAAMKYSIRGIPTLILFKKGEIIWRTSGLVSRNDLKSNLSYFLQD